MIAKEPWQAGMFCLSIYKEDGEAYEGLVKSIEGSESDGGQYAVVQFIGYGNEDTVWLQDLRQSKGEAARRQQTERAEVVDDSGKIFQFIKEKSTLKKSFFHRISAKKKSI